MKSNANPAPAEGRAEIESLDRWTRRQGVSRTTVWRWRRAGWLKTVMLAGRPYVLRQDADAFLDRVARGECAKLPTVAL